MPKVRADELRTRTTEELRRELEETRRQLMDLRFRKAIRQLQDTTQIRKTRRKVARILTVLRERELMEG